MTTTTKTLTKDEFDDYETNLRLFTHEHARRYACLELPDSERTFAFSWRSDMIEPSVVVDESGNTIWVGVDDRLASVSSDGQIRFSLALSSQLLTVELKGGKAVAVCELQAIVVSEGGSINEIIDFPDAVDDFSVNDTSISASFMDGSSAEFPI